MVSAIAANPPAEDLSDRQNFSIAVPHRHCGGFTAAQPTQEGVGSFLLVCHLPPGPFLCQVHLRPGPACTFNVASFSFAYRTAGLANLFRIFLLFAGGNRETDSLHPMDLHKRQVKLEYRRKILGQPLLNYKCAIMVPQCHKHPPGPVHLCACRGT